MTPANAERQWEEFMTQNVWFIAAIWMALALSASLISIWAGISVALVEILVGVIAGNFLGIHATTDWINFLALLGSGVLTFLAGAEIDPRSLKANLRAFSPTSAAAAWAERY
jgi:Kef-type K+ transport system membrane component KefB